MPAILDKIAGALHLHKSHPDAPKEHSEPPKEAATGSAASPVFDKSKVTVLFVLGGPGAGEAAVVAPA